MKRVVVIGLGIFGSQLARQLYDKGIEVVAIDKNKDIVQRIKDHSTKAVLADATNKEVLESIGIAADDTVVISFGEDLSASTLLTLYLKEMQVREIIVKVPNDDYKRILLKVGASEAIIPEREMANKVARSIISPNVLEYLPISEDYTICELAPPTAFIGKSLAELDLRKRYQLQVIAIRDVLSESLQLVPRASSVIKDSDVLVIVGREEDIQKVK
ncbi:MAG: TrkA family potassium uptake protein [Desulfobacterales bacterium]|jgi:trk system potassium uptake protein TrkA|nr:TrkA family potassium uptake protein [Desulfobacterales bacterium]